MPSRCRSGWPASARSTSTVTGSNRCRPDTIDDGQVFAEIALTMLVSDDPGSPSDVGNASLDDLLIPAMHVYQAQGMVMVDLGVSLAEALVRLRAYAFVQGRPVAEVARDAVAGACG